MAEVSCETYVEFLYPGVFLVETSVEQIANREIATLVIPRWAFGFRFYDEVIVLDVSVGQPIKLHTLQVNRSSTYYLGGHVYTKDEIRQLPSSSPLFSSREEILANMQGEVCVVKTRRGTVMPFHPEDVLLPDTTEPTS